MHLVNDPWWKKVHEQMLNQKFINQFERIFKCCFCFFHDKRIEKYMYCVKIQIEYFFPLWCMFVISNSVHSTYCIMYFVQFLCYCYRHVDYTSSCAVVWPIKLTNKKTVETCDFWSDNLKKNLKISEMHCKHDLVNWYSISLVKVKSFSEPWRNIRPALCFPWS